MRQAGPGEINGDFVDRFTVTHFVAGMALGGMGATAVQALISTILWEAVEPGLKRAFPAVFPNATIDTMENKVGDSVFWMLGWLAGSAIIRHRMESTR